MQHLAKASESRSSTARLASKSAAAFMLVVEAQGEADYLVQAMDPQIAHRNLPQLSFCPCSPSIDNRAYSCQVDVGIATFFVCLCVSPDKLVYLLHQQASHPPFLIRFERTIGRCAS